MIRDASRMALSRRESFRTRRGWFLGAADGSECFADASERLRMILDASRMVLRLRG